jgi:hypothetical protein
MLQGNIARFLCLGLLCAAASVAYAQDFSADLVDLASKSATNVGKVYAKGDKLRVDRADAKDEGTRPVVIVDSTKRTVTILDASSHSYLKIDIGGEAGTPFFRLEDVNNACPELDKMAGMQGSCRKVGNETVNRRATVKYEGKSEDGAQILMWGDPEINYVVKWQAKGGETGEIRNIKIGPQANNLFEVPSGYREAGESGSKAGTTDQKQLSN